MSREKIEGVAIRTMGMEEWEIEIEESEWTV